MILLEVYPSKVLYSGLDPEVEKMLECLRVRNKGARYQIAMLRRHLRFMKPDDPRRAGLLQAIQGARWTKFYNSRYNWFAVGLLNRVCDYLREQGCAYQAVDHRPKLPDLLPAAFYFKDQIEVRKEQLQVLEAVCRRGCGLVHASPNFGKTEIACAVAALFHRRVGRWPRTLYLVHRLGLAVQTRKRFQQHLGIPVGLLGGGEFHPREITVSTVQTLHRKLSVGKKLLSACELVFLDEIHVNQARQAYRLMLRCPARMRFGLSGTIAEAGERRLRMEQLVGPVVAEVKNLELIQLGRSAMPLIRLVTVSSKVVVGSYARAYFLGVVENTERNRLVVRETLGYVERNLRVLVCVSLLRQGFLLRDALIRQEIEAEFLRGATPQFIRDQLKQRFVAGKLPVLIVSTVFDVGEDLPEIDAAVLAGGGVGWELVIQRVGRTMRRKAGRNIVYLTDFLDTHNKHLMRHSLRRWQFYRKEGFKIQVVKEAA